MRSICTGREWSGEITGILHRGVLMNIVVATGRIIQFSEEIILRTLIITITSPATGKKTGDRDLDSVAIVTIMGIMVSRDGSLTSAAVMRPMTGETGRTVIQTDHPILLVTGQCKRTGRFLTAILTASHSGRLIILTGSRKSIVTDYLKMIAQSLTGIVRGK
jgi:hypothetical protein